MPATRVQQTQAVITPAPIIAERDGNGPVWAYWPTGTSIQTFFCGTDETYATSLNYGGCYGTDYLASSKPIHYGCTQLLSTASGLDNGVIQCILPSASCITQTIYATSPDIGDSVTDYFCGVGGAWSALTVFRDIPSTSSSSSSSTSSSFPSSTSSLPSTTSSASPNSSSTVASPTSSSTSTPTSTSHKSGSSSSKAWIAGPVLGAIAVLGFVAFLVWYFWNRKRKSNLAAENRQSHNQDYPQYTEVKPPAPPAEVQGSQPSQHTYHTGYNQPELHELS